MADEPSSADFGYGLRTHSRTVASESNAGTVTRGTAAGAAHELTWKRPFQRCCCGQIPNDRSTPPGCSRAGRGMVPFANEASFQQRAHGEHVASGLVYFTGILFDELPASHLIVPTLVRSCYVTESQLCTRAVHAGRVYITAKGHARSSSFNASAPLCRMPYDRRQRSLAYRGELRLRLFARSALA